MMLEVLDSVLRSLLSSVVDISEAMEMTSDLEDGEVEKTQPDATTFSTELRRACVLRVCGS